ncbi:MULTISPECIES: CaiB/BaiF CoA transferase family protein [Thalassobaculum]|uniref:CoA-transferase family III n=1 Tax=Thalassobaculum litoreum DSM 18839 TaxID=1123362 RepID=A0A8G2EUQ3_9PROT|nr:MULTISPECIES: CaiB/BaiF CoA-transferase family protein [Thalassobaculum]SDF50528.1 CoA-transferase family III [Thalassobaculum litoreum DSM 18839]
MADKMRPLEGLTVLALEQAVAAPFCTSRLADAGARVIKIERPEGDFARGYDDVAQGQSSYFVWLNRGKESLVLDLASDAGKQTLGTLIAEADVLVQNLKPGAIGRLGFPLEQIRRDHPKLILCSISGYGDSGPLAKRKAYDLLIQAESGLCSITGGSDGPARVGISVVDIATGSTAHAAILEALIGRGIHGDGADIRISMFDVMADWETVPLLNHEGGKSPKRIGLAHPSISPYGAFASSDGILILISIQSEREWASLARHVLGDEGLTVHELYKTNVLRVRNRPQTDGLVAEVFSRHTADALEAMLDKADVAFARVNDMDALAAHPHVRRVTVETPNGPVSYPAPAAIVDGRTRSYGPVPAVGEHKDLDLG